MCIIIDGTVLISTYNYYIYDYYYLIKHSIQLNCMIQYMLPFVCCYYCVFILGDIVLESTLKEAQLKAVELKLQLRSASDSYNAKFNRYWGQLFKAGHHDSQFAKQVRMYACIYTSRVSNLGYVSPNR